MNVFFLEIRNLRRSSLIHTLYVCVAMFMMFALFPAMQNDSMKALTNAKIEGLKGFSPAMLTAFGLSDFMINFSIVTNFFGYLIRYIALAIMVLVVQQAVALTVKEESDGTIEYLCSKPISRDELFFQKLLAHVTIFFVMTIVFCIVGILGYMTVGDCSFSKAVNDICILFFGIFYVGIVFSAVGILFSVIIRSSKGVSGITIAIVFTSFFLGLIPALTNSLDFLVLFSPLDWIRSEKLLSKGILTYEWVVGCTVIIGCTLIAWRLYRKKDLLI